MLLDRANITPLKRLAKGGRMPAINFEGKGTTATNGHIVLWVPYPKALSMSTSGLPGREDPVSEDFPLDAELAEMVASVIPKKLKGVPGIASVSTAKPEADGEKKLGIVSWAASMFTKATWNGRLPVVGSILKSLRRRKSARVYVTPDLLAKLLYAMYDVCVHRRGGGQNTVAIDFPIGEGAETQPIFLVPISRDPEVRGMWGAVMPVQLFGEKEKYADKAFEEAGLEEPEEEKKS